MIISLNIYLPLFSHLNSFLNEVKIDLINLYFLLYSIKPYSKRSSQRFIFFRIGINFLTNYQKKIMSIFSFKIGWKKIWVCLIRIISILMLKEISINTSMLKFYINSRPITISIIILFMLDSHLNEKWINMISIIEQAFTILGIILLAIIKWTNLILNGEIEWELFFNFFTPWPLLCQLNPILILKQSASFIYQELEM